MALRSDGSLGVAPPGGRPVGSFNSQVLALDVDGYGWLRPTGEVTLRTANGVAKRVGDNLVF